MKWYVVVCILIGIVWGAMIYLAEMQQRERFQAIEDRFGVIENRLDRLERGAVPAK
jgi:hypothetical protein